MADIGVQAPDGRTVYFPEGTSTDDISRVMRNYGMLKPPEPKAGKGTILPMSWDEQGNTSFDLTAGLPGSLWRAVTAPGDVYKGKLDPYSDEAKLRAFEFASWFNPVNPAVRAGDRAFPGELMATKAPKPPVPTVAELKTATDTGYKAVRGTGAEYAGSAVKSLADQVRSALEAKGFITENAPQTYGILNKLGRVPDEPSVVTISALDAARQAFGKLGSDQERAAGRIVINAIDDFIQAGAQKGSMAGAPAATGTGAANLPGIAGPVAENPLEVAARLIREARGNAAAKFRSESVAKAEEVANMRAAAAGSGQNLGNSLRQKVATLLLDEDKIRGFNQEELAALRQIVDGTASMNTLRRVSNWLGGGGGAMQSLVTAGGGYLGAELGGPGGAFTGALAGPIAGQATRSGYNALTERNLRLADELIRMRSPLYQQRLAATPPDVVSPLLRSLPPRLPMLAAPGMANQDDPRFSVRSRP